VAVLDGQLRVGLADEELERLAACEKAIKVSRRDMSSGLANGLSGGTTVSGTLAAAGMANWPPLFVTGGLGGVHRGGEASMDVSADLVELGRARTAVLSAGIKSILDIGRTLEVLETQGVSVVTLGETDDFPAFFSRASAYKSPGKVSNPLEAAKLVLAHRELNLDSGMLLAAPIPTEHEAADVERAILAALAEAERAGVTGAAVTPFVLRRVDEESSGASLKANLALIENNASLGARLAVDLADLVLRGRKWTASGQNEPEKRPLVVGGSIYDLIVRVEDEGGIRLDGSTHAGRVQSALGGVARNVADAMAKLGGKAKLLSAVGDDDRGKLIKSE